MALGLRTRPSFCTLRSAKSDACTPARWVTSKCRILPSSHVRRRTWNRFNNGVFRKRPPYPTLATLCLPPPGWAFPSCLRFCSLNPPKQKMRHHSLRFFVLTFLAPLALSSAASAQIVGGQVEQFWQFDGVAQNDQCAYSVSGAGDVDGDGFDDVIVGANKADPGGLTDAGSAFVYSGFDGTLIWRFDGATPGDLLGSSVSGAGDVDGDGFDDLVVGAIFTDPGGLTDVGSAFVYSGSDGAPIWQFDGVTAGGRFGLSVSGAGDVNGDGFADVIVGAPYTNSAFAYSGFDGSLIWQFSGVADWLGYSVSGAGDVDGDGFDDLIIGAIFANPGGLASAGSAFVYSGFDGTSIWQFDGAGESDYLGFSVSGAGDADDDGFDDLIVGAIYADPGGLVDAGSAFVHSGFDGSLIWQFDGATPGGNLGYSVSDAGDVNRDGFDDLIVSAVYSALGAGSAFVHSGFDGSLTWRFDGTTPNERMGFSSSGAGDVNGNGFDDVIVGAILADPGGVVDAGSAFVFGLSPFLLPTTLEVNSSGSALVGYQLDFPEAAAFDEYKLLISSSGNGPTLFGVQIPLTLDTLVLNSYFGSYPGGLLYADMHGVLNASGDGLAVIGIPLPVILNLLGTELQLAAICNVPGYLPRFSSIAVPLRFVP